MSKTGPLSTPDPRGSALERRLSAIETRLDRVEPLLLTLNQIIHGDAGLRLPALADSLAIIHKQEARIEELERAKVAWERVEKELREKIAELEQDKPGELAKEKGAIEVWLIRYDAYIKMAAMVGAGVAAITGLISALRGQPPTLGGP